MRKSAQPDGCLMIIAVSMGIIAFMVIEHPVFFWLVFVPLAVVGIANFILWLKK